MRVFGVINTSPDSLNDESIAANVTQAMARGQALLASGADAIDVGGQGSSGDARLVDWRVEWNRLQAIVPALAGLGVPVSVDTWRPEIARRALAAGATVLNATDGMQNEAMWEVAAEADVPIVIPFLSGPNPRAMRHVERDPIDAIVEFVEARLATADRYGLRERCIIDPGTGFAPRDWPWEDRYRYQRCIYSNLDQLRRWELPLYVALPWHDTPQHVELAEIALRHDPEYVRAHYPARVRALEQQLDAR